ncbi:MAG: aspartate/glutamate racemase family protein [Victivallaceae bacterium]|nr:aspartate/glutamate racemase family protein [Victivallaceae bacterium]
MKDKIRIIITDSGLGGLGFSAGLAERLKAEACFQEVELIFFNCCPSAEQGYQALETNEQRSKNFSCALFAISEKFSPDLIIIACNSLSAIYKDTQFAENALIPVIGIIESGTQCVSELFSEDTELNMLMFATPATVSTGIHKQILIDAGFSPERLFYQECSGLPRAIAYGDKTKIDDSINDFMDSAVSQLAGKSFAVSLFCTHFGYAREVFGRAARQYSNFSGQILDPNSALLDLVLSKHESGRFDSTDLSIKVVSQIKQSDQMKNTIIPFIQDISPATVKALHDDIHLPELFSTQMP